MNRKFRCLISCMVALFLIGCATMPKTQEQAYFEALQTYNNWGQTYKFHFALAPEEVQNKWIETINPVFQEASDILDVWGAALTAGKNETDAINKWTKIKRELILLLSNEKVMGGQK